MALTPVAQNAAARSAVRRSKNSAASRKSGTMVSAPSSTFGNRSAASSLIRPISGACAFHARAASTATNISDFINIGCSALAVMSPRRYEATASSLLISSSANPTCPSPPTRSEKPSAASSTSNSTACRSNTSATPRPRELNPSASAPVLSNSIELAK